MSNAAFTLVQNDMVILNLWVSYYRRYFDRLHVVCNGTKDEYTSYLDTQPFTYERVDGFAGNSDATVKIVRETQRKLLETYNWVLYSDCDEYVIADPEKYEDLKDFMNKCPLDKTHCEGYEVLQDEDEKPIDYSKAYLAQRKYWFKDHSYNKPLLAKVPIDWNPGCHKEYEVADEDSKEIKDTGLFLVHLKFSDLEAQRDFGPTKTVVQGNVLEAGRKEKQPIPEKIRSLF